MVSRSRQFYVECGLDGARLMSTTLYLTANLSVGEIDSKIQRLKDDLDVCAREMKRRAGELGRRGAFRESAANAIRGH